METETAEVVSTMPDDLKRAYERLLGIAKTVQFGKETLLTVYNLETTLMDKLGCSRSKANSLTRRLRRAKVIAHAPKMLEGSHRATNSSRNARLWVIKKPQCQANSDKNESQPSSGSSEESHPEVEDALSFLQEWRQETSNNEVGGLIDRAHRLLTGHRSKDPLSPEGIKQLRAITAKLLRRFRQPVNQQLRLVCLSVAEILGKLIGAKLSKKDQLEAERFVSHLRRSTKDESSATSPD